MKKEDYERIYACLNKTYPVPTDDEIADSMVKIEAKLQIKAINKYVNAPIKEGYTKALEILRCRQKDYSNIETLKTHQGRAIAMISVDYLKGQCDPVVLCGVPLK